MKISLSWLKEYIDIDISPAELADALTMAGLEVDCWEQVKPSFEGVVVAEVLEVSPHPNADKLCQATVTDGENQYHIVCGAPNCRKGLITALAKTGAQLQDTDGNTFKIKKSKLRGVESEGMLCAGDELNISEDDSGILEITGLKVGTDLAQLFSDTIFEISLTPNLSYCNSVIGVARELSAILDKPLKYPQVEISDNLGEHVGDTTSVTIENFQDCPRYTCRVIKDVSMTSSPLWLQQRLISADIRPINNIVDITNYVLLEYGHPLHAFDYDTLSNHQIIVKNAHDDMKFTTLDDQERSLYDDTLMICDGEKPIAIGGVMGGANTEINATTKNVLLESAYFAPSSIRRTSKKLSLSTDSSHIFERGTDPNNIVKALDRAASLIQQLGNGKVAEGIIDVKEGTFTEKIITCRLSRVNKILGSQISISEVEAIFKRLNFGVEYQNQDTLSVHVPTYRVDIGLEIDLIEEVARIYGYNDLPKKQPMYKSCDLATAQIHTFENTIRDYLLREGLQEFVSCDLISPKAAQLVNASFTTSEKLVIVKNPKSAEQSTLRPSLLPSLLQIAKNNQDHNNHDVMGFEIGHVYFQDDDEYKEYPMVAVVLAGKNIPQNWKDKPREVDFFDLKGIIENLFSGMAIQEVSFETSQFDNFHPGRQASIMVNDLRVGILGEIHPSTNKAMGIDGRVFFAELNLQDLFNVKKATKKISSPPTFPGSERDWTISISKNLAVQEILNLIKETPSSLLESASLIDVYEGDKVAQNYRNVTFHFAYRDKNKTISFEEVEAEHNMIVDKITKTFALSENK